MQLGLLNFTLWQHCVCYSPGAFLRWDYYSVDVQPLLLLQKHAQPQNKCTHTYTHKIYFSKWLLPRYDATLFWHNYLSAGWAQWDRSRPQETMRVCVCLCMNTHHQCRFASPRPRLAILLNKLSLSSLHDIWPETRLENSRRIRKQVNWDNELERKWKTERICAGINEKKSNI